MSQGLLLTIKYTIWLTMSATQLPLVIRRRASAFGSSLLRTQNLKAMLATSWYSYFENLYFNVVRNFGLTSSTKLLTSSTIFCISSSLYSVAFSISLFHTLTLLMHLVDRINAAAAISLGQYFSRDASSRAISWIYYAKKKILSSLATDESFLKRSKNL